MLSLVNGVEMRVEQKVNMHVKSVNIRCLKAELLKIEPLAQYVA